MISSFPLLEIKYTEHLALVEQDDLCLCVPLICKLEQLETRGNKANKIRPSVKKCNCLQAHEKHSLHKGTSSLKLEQTM